jgi:hypothetical protein
VIEPQYDTSTGEISMEWHWDSHDWVVSDDMTIYGHYYPVGTFGVTITWHFPALMTDYPDFDVYGGYDNISAYDLARNILYGDSLDRKKSCCEKTFSELYSTDQYVTRFPGPTPPDITYNGTTYTWKWEYGNYTPTQYITLPKKIYSENWAEDKPFVTTNETQTVHVYGEYVDSEGVNIFRSGMTMTVRYVYPDYVAEDILSYPEGNVTRFYGYYGLFEVTLPNPNDHYKYMPEWTDVSGNTYKPGETYYVRYSTEPVVFYAVEREYKVPFYIRALASQNGTVSVYLKKTVEVPDEKTQEWYDDTWSESYRITNTGSSTVIEMQDYTLGERYNT